MAKKKIPQYLTPEGTFDEKSANVERARERQRRGLVGFTRNDQFAKVMTSSSDQNIKEAEQRGNKARGETVDQEFSDQYDSLLGRGRKRMGGGRMGSFSQ